MKNKMLALLLVGVMGVSALAGCGNHDSEVKESAAEQVSESTAEQVSESAAEQSSESESVEVVELTNAERYPIAGSPELTILTNKEVDLMNNSEIYSAYADYVGIVPTYEFATPEQIALLVAAEDIPDIIYFAPFKEFGMEKINAAGEAGLIINYADYWDKLPNLKRLYEEHPEAYNTVMNSDGSFYTLPKYGVTLTGNYEGIYYREDHMKQAGWEKAPTTIDEFTQFLRDLKTTFADDKGYIPMTALEESNMLYNKHMSDALFPAFGDLPTNEIVVDNDGTVVAGFVTEQYQRYLKYLNELVEEGLLDSNCMTPNTDIMKEFLQNGHSSVCTKLSSLTKDAFASGKLEYSMFTPFTSEYTSEQKCVMEPAFGYWTGLISSETENLDAALAYMDGFFCTQDDPLNDEGTFWGVSTYIGEYGVAWEWIEEDVSFVRFVPEGYESASQYGSVNGWSQGAYYAVWDKVEVRDGEPRLAQSIVRENRVPYIKDVITSNHIVVSPEEEEIIDDYLFDIISYVDQMNAAFITGQADIDTDFEAFVANLEAMGLQDVLDAYQSAYDRMSDK